MNDNYSETSLSLLLRLKKEPMDDASWSEFVVRYEPLILRWCAKWGLQNADASDVSQNVLLKIAKHMSKFEYRPDGGFRKWLRKVTYNAWCDHLSSSKWSGAGGDAIRVVFESAEARDNLLDMIEDEYNRQIIGDAKAIVKAKVEPHIWSAFEMLAEQSVPVAEVADQLQITTGNAYVSKSRVQRMLTDEIAKIESASDIA